MRKHFPKLLLLSGFLLSCVSCDLFYPKYAPKEIPPLPPAMLIGK